MSGLTFNIEVSTVRPIFGRQMMRVMASVFPDPAKRQGDKFTSVVSMITMTELVSSCAHLEPIYVSGPSYWSGNSITELVFRVSLWWLHVKGTSCGNIELSSQPCEQDTGLTSLGHLGRNVRPWSAKPGYDMFRLAHHFSQIF
jgi:hypothetical protein